MYTGVIENINDPEKLGRVQVRFFKIHTEIKESGVDFGIPTKDLPWANVMLPTTSASINGLGQNHNLVNGTWVVAFFRDSHMQEPIIIGTLPSKSTVNVDTTKGFNDPNGIYPKTDFIGESDINRLARNEKIELTIVKSKQDSRKLGVNTASGGTWDEPEIPYNAEYPNNNVIESKSGHIQEIDDTPEHERIHTYHNSGTFEEIHPDGKRVLKIVGENYTIILDNNQIFIDGNSNETISGDKTIKANNLNINISGTADINIPTTNHTGNINLTGDINMTGNIALTGDIIATGTVKGGTVVTTLDRDLDTHIHTGGTIAGKTGAPV